jgi:hypothetical protein
MMFNVNIEGIKPKNLLVFPGAPTCSVTTFVPVTAVAVGKFMYREEEWPSIETYCGNCEETFYRRLTVDDGTSFGVQNS